jgi:hypothetical protein
MLTVQQLIPMLQIAVGPVVLISGVGLLILSMTNRLGRVIDRGRSLVRELPEIPERNHAGVVGQLRILSRRADLLQQAIFLRSSACYSRRCWSSPCSSPPRLDWKMRG